MSAQINLYNPALRLRRRYITGPAVLLGVLVIVLGVVGAQGYQQIRLGALSREAADVEATLKDRQDELARLSKDVKKMKARKRTMEELAAAEALLRGHEQVAASVDAGVIGTTQGFSDVMRALARRAVNGIWVSALAIDAGGGEMSIAGHTLDPDLLPGYIKRLNEEKVIRGRGFAFLELQQPQPRTHHHDFVLRVDGRADADAVVTAQAPAEGEK